MLGPWLYSPGLKSTATIIYVALTSSPAWFCPSVQVPMLQAHATFQRLLCSMTGLKMTESAGELATRDGIIRLLSNAGYRDVQVIRVRNSFV